MHEMAIAQNILDLVGHEMEKYPGAKLIGFDIQVGEFSCVQNEALTFCLGACLNETPRPDADIRITAEVLRTRCKSCDHAFTPVDHTFICPNCGPRYTILDDLPYDRPMTSMCDFPRCPDCKREYDDPPDRRFHAQPVCCPNCGPKLELLDASGRAIETDEPIQHARDAIKSGRIVDVIVMTSANFSDEPILADTGQAVEGMGSVVDLFLTHDREIRHRADDSVARIAASAGHRSRNHRPRAGRAKSASLPEDVNRRQPHTPNARYGTVAADLLIPGFSTGWG